MNPEPRDSAGLQLGNFGGTGVAAQRLGVRDGALNVGLGFADRGIALHGDYVRFVTAGLQLIKTPKSPGYNGMRGRFTPYGGAGVQIGRGVSLRVPIGVQYAMRRDPFNFYGGLTLMIGSFFSDDDKVGVNLGILAGARVLL